MRPLSLRSFARWAALLATLAAFLGGALPVSANHIPYVVGDVFAGIGQGKINHYSPTGLLIEQLDTTGTSNEQTGMCFGESGNLRSTNFSANNMTLFNNMGGVITHPWGGPFNTHPESCVLNAAGDIYVGQADGSRDVLKFNASGTQLASYDVGTGSRGSDWIDLAADQKTLYYTSEDRTIHRFDVSTSTQGANFNPAALPSGPCYALRIRTNGEVMVACSDSVFRLDSAGAVIQTYPKPAAESGTFLFALNLDPDNATFWTAGFRTGNIYRINIASGVVVTTFTAPANPTLAGLAVFGEITVARPPAKLTLEPKTDTNPVSVGAQHCVTATVTDATAQPLKGVTVVFSVTATAGNNASGSVDTDASGQAQFCYLGPTTPGVDAIHAFADNNKNGTQETGEPFDDATKTWVAGAPASLTLAPKTATNTAGDKHCVSATVTDQFGNPTPNITVNFSVSGPNGPLTGSAVTDASGVATFCYTGTHAGTDTITATAVGGSNPSDTATKTYKPGPPASLVLTPPTATNVVDAQHCVTATVKDQFGNPTPGITVQFSVSPTTFRTPPSGSAVTDANGQATFCYTSALPGNDVISAFADTNGNGVQDANEPSGRAIKTWILPASTPGCKVTDGGRITAANGDKATFGSVAKVAADGTPSGAQEYQDHGAAADLNVHSTAVLAVTCSRDGKSASVFGTATINGAGSYNYRIDLTDNGEPGTADTYQIRLSNGYDSGLQVLSGGNIQIH